MTGLGQNRSFSAQRRKVRFSRQRTFHILIAVTQSRRRPNPILSNDIIVRGVGISFTPLRLHCMYRKHSAFTLRTA